MDKTKRNNKIAILLNGKMFVNLYKIYHSQYRDAMHSIEPSGRCFIVDHHCI